MIYDEFRASTTMEKTAILLLFSAFGAVTYYSRAFAKIQIGPAYALEIAFLLVAPVFMLKNFKACLRVPVVASAGAFFLLGAAITVFDLAFHGGEGFSFRGLAQHALLYVYPLIWAALGAAVARRYHELPEALAVAVLGLSVPSYFFHLGDHTLYEKGISALGANLALGPLTVLAAAFSLARFFRGRKPVFAVATLVFCFVAYLPYWQMFHAKFQRSTLMLLIFMIASAPLALHLRRLKSGARDALILLAIFFAGAAATVIITRNEATGAREQVLRSLQHSDDGPLGPDEKDQGQFQFRSRRTWWSSAVDQWKSAPLFGVGFAAEVPKYILPGVLNNGHFEGYTYLRVLGGKPLSGPHNSYLSVMARTGLAGAAVFAFFLFLGIRALRETARRTFETSNLPGWFELGRLVMIFIPLNGLLFALVSTGFESPHTAVLLWFFIGCAAKRSCK